MRFLGFGGQSFDQKWEQQNQKLMNEQNIKIKTVPHFWPPVEKRATLVKVVERRLPTWLVQKYLQQTICTSVYAHKMSPGNGNKQLFSEIIN